MKSSPREEALTPALSQRAREQNIDDELELPEGWAVTTLGHLVELKYGKGLTKEHRVSGVVPVYGSNGVVGYHNRSVTHGPTIIVGRKGSVGEVHFSPGACWPIDTTYFADDFCGLDPQFLLHTLRALDLAQHESSTAIPGLSRDDAYAQEVFVPPLAEQQRIVAQVEALLARVNAARARLAKVPAILKRFRQSVLAAACSGRLMEEWREQSPGENARRLVDAIADERERLGLATARREIEDEGIEIPESELPSEWVWCRVGNIADVRLGGTPSRKEPRFWNGTIPWVSSGEVANDRIAVTNESITKAGLENSSAKVYPKGTVLIAMIGEGRTRGQAAILDIEASTNQNVAGLVFDAGWMSPDYAWYWALSEYEKNRGVGRGGNYPALNGRKVRAFPFPLPPLGEQHEIVCRVDALFTLADAIERRVAAATARAEKLTQAILAKAFRGELVPTEAELARREGRDYEPASVLLERIRAERASRQSSARGQGRRERTRGPRTQSGRNARTAEA